MKNRLFAFSISMALVLSLAGCGKTGTAQYGEEGRSHSWFVGFTRTGGKDIVVCALTEGGGDGIYSATYVAKQVFYAWGNQ